MARNEKGRQDRNILLAPALHGPRGAAVIDGSAVTFRWEPVEEATSYRLEVATDPAFEHRVYEEEVSGEEEPAVGGID